MEPNEEKEIITSHSFEEAKNQIAEFSKNANTAVEFDRVDTDGGLFGWFDHTVTGEELNKLTAQVQEQFIQTNKYASETAKEFGQVYQALEALDKDYIQAILISVESAKKASKEAKDAQKDIKKTIEIQRKTIDVLKEFKSRVEGQKHIGDVDDIWSDVDSIKKSGGLDDISTLNLRIKRLYWILGGVTSLCVLQFILNILGVM